MQKLVFNLENDTSRASKCQCCFFSISRFNNNSVRTPISQKYNLYCVGSNTGFEFGSRSWSKICDILKITKNAIIRQILILPQQMMLAGQNFSK